MAPTVLSGELSELSDVERQPPPSSRVPAVLDALDEVTIADLPWTRISEMNRDELVRVIQKAHLPFLSEERCAHLTFRDRQTLERLACLAQRCCFNRTSRPGSPAGNTTNERQTFDA